MVDSGIKSLVLSSNMEQGLLQPGWSMHTPESVIPEGPATARPFWYYYI